MATDRMAPSAAQKQQAQETCEMSKAFGRTFSKNVFTDSGEVEEMLRSYREDVEDAASRLVPLSGNKNGLMCNW